MATCPICRSEGGSSSVCVRCGSPMTSGDSGDYGEWTLRGGNSIDHALPPTQASPSESSKRVAAGVCGILVGWLGIHKFVLGYTTQGLIMLLVTVLTCGFGGIVMSIIGLIEGIIYLTKSEAEFRRIYESGNRGWF